ncbi:MAG: hypothetical protein GY861_09610, partial [bacterium]|nr:hypothetical protein [bacterium]
MPDFNIAEVMKSLGVGQKAQAAVPNPRPTPFVPQQPPPRVEPAKESMNPQEEENLFLKGQMLGLMSQMGGGQPAQEKEPNLYWPKASAPRERNLSPLREAIGRYEGKETKTDLSPLVALIDSWGGSKLMSGYQRPVSESQKQDTITKLKMQLSEREAEASEATAKHEDVNKRLKAWIQSKEQGRKKDVKLADLKAQLKMTTEAKKESKGKDIFQSKARKDNKKFLEELSSYLSTEDQIASELDSHEAVLGGVDYAKKNAGTSGIPGEFKQWNKMKQYNFVLNGLLKSK